LQVYLLYLIKTASFQKAREFTICFNKKKALTKTCKLADNKLAGMNVCRLRKFYYYKMWGKFACLAYLKKEITSQTRSQIRR
jgi:hypothetical protein